MNFQTMEYFTVLARERSYTRAAEMLHITQQSLSAHIASVERELGCRLVVRHTPLELTYAGRVFLRYAEKMRAELREMQQEFCDISENQKGELRIGVAYTRGRILMPRLITAFRQEYPNVAVMLTEESNETLQKLLLEGKIDLAIANFTKAPEGCELQDFYEENIVLLIHPKLAQRFDVDARSCADMAESGTVGPLKDCPFLTVSAEDIAGRIGHEILARSGFEPRVCTKSDNMETLLALCEQGEGACFVPENLARFTLSRESLSQMYFIRFTHDALYPIRFGYLRRSYEWSMISEFIRIAKTPCGEKHGDMFVYQI